MLDLRRVQGEAEGGIAMEYFWMIMVYIFYRMGKDDGRDEARRDRDQA